MAEDPTQTTHFADGFWRGWFWGGAAGLILFSGFVCWSLL